MKPGTTGLDNKVTCHKYSCSSESRSIKSFCNLEHAGQCFGRLWVLQIMVLKNSQKQSLLFGIAHKHKLFACLFNTIVLMFMDVGTCAHFLDNLVP